MEAIKFAVFYALVFMFFFGCTDKTEKSKTNESTEKEMIEETLSHPAGTIMLIVKAKTELPEQEFLKIAKEREPQFAAIPGLIQKYYIKTKNPGEYGGVYIWDSVESLNKYRESDLAATIAQAYKTIGPPSTEIIDILFELRE
jgi:heme-degrading monooxygenase HmoA